MFRLVGLAFVSVPRHSFRVSASLCPRHFALRVLRFWGLTLPFIVLLISVDCG